MRTAFFRHVNLDPERTHLPRGDAADPEAEAARYEAAISAAGGIGLQILGIGRNGHLAFNEPTSSLASRTRVKALTEATRASNAPAFEPADVPRHAITVGIATIMEAREVVLLATGSSKAAAVRSMIEGSVNTYCPASILQFHPRATVILDQAAASGLTLRDYFETVHPGGQEVVFG